MIVTRVSRPGELHSRFSGPASTHRKWASVSSPRFLIGNKSDLRDPSRTDCQVSQERARSFAKAHGMTFFETSAKNPLKKQASRRRGDGEVLHQQDAVEDIVAAVGATLKKHKSPLTANSPAYSGSFRVNKKIPEKELWTCC